MELTNEKIADWYAKEFKGYLVELDDKGRPDIEYRLWDHIKTQDKNTKFFQSTSYSLGICCFITQ